MLIPPNANVGGRGAEKVTDLNDISFKEIQEGYQAWDTRVLAYAPDSNFRFRFVNITHLLKPKRKWLIQSRLSVKGS
jgi:hypothetical protein